MTIRILSVACTAQVSGAQVSLLGLLEHLDTTLFEPLVAVPGEGPLTEKLRSIDVNATVLRLGKASKRNPIPFFTSIWTLAWLMRLERIDIVHVNHEFANRHTVLASRLAGVPNICHVRNIQTRKSVRDLWLGKSPFLIANSHATARSYEPHLRATQKSSVVYNGVDLARFDGTRCAKSRFGVPDDAYLIAQIGRIAPEKGLHHFVESLRRIARIRPNVHALIAGSAAVRGSPEYLCRLQRQVEHYGIASKVKFLGHVDHIQAVYGASDLVVQPSMAEPFGRTIVEAMAMRVPVIATRAGGAPELVEDTVTGVLVEPNDVDGLTQAIQSLMEDRPFAKRMGQAGRERVKLLFTADRHARCVEAVYQDIFAR